MSPTTLLTVALSIAAQVRTQHHETPDDPYRAPDPDAVAPTPPAVAGGDIDFGVQVNVDSFGLNIPGDAANEPSIAIDPTAPNRMVIGWRQFDTVVSNFRQAGWAYSHDGGRTWTFPGRIQAGTFRSDPVLGADANGNFFYCSLRGDFAVHYFVSADGGVTWGPQLPIGPTVGGDKQWFSIDRTGGVGEGNIYMTWNIAAGCCGGDSFSRSTDGGVTFETPLFIFGQPRFGNTAIGPDGAFYTCGTTAGNFNIFEVARSTNAQLPMELPVFDEAAVIDLGGAMALGTAPNPSGLMGQANVSVDHSEGPTRGNVYLLCSVNPSGPDGADVMFSRSEDGGSTWTDPIRVNDDGGDDWQWMGTMSVSPDGRIDAVWNDTRNSGVSNLSETYYSFSTDAGDTWSPNVPISPAWNSLVGFPNQSKIGDYYDMESDAQGADLTYATTLNGEQDVYYLRIGPRDCNRNGESDEQDLLDGTSADCNANGIPDECEIAAGQPVDPCPCPYDCAGDDGIVDTLDFLALLGQWGQVGSSCDPDNDGVDTIDFLALLAAWGPC